MPKMPTEIAGGKKELNATSVDIMNTIRANASPEYQAQIPIASPNTDSIRSIGQIIMDYQPFKNEFLNALINRIARVLITSKMYDNPWASFKKGLLEYGETVEEIFVNLAHPKDYDPEVAETQIFKREIPDVMSAFHVMNYKKFYKVTIQNDELRTAFLSWNGITDLITRIIDSLYAGANYDEFITMKYLVAKMALNGNISAKVIPDVTAANAKSIVSTIKGISNTWEFMSSAYNMAGVKTYTNKRDQFILMNAAFDATIDVEVLASAFNLSKAEFMGNRVLVDSFADQDVARLSELFANDPTYTPFTDDELAKLETIPAIMIDRDWFMIFDNFYNFTQQYNGEGLYWNYWYHTWKTFSASPFANAIMFTTSTNSVTAVSVAPAAATMSPGSTLTFEPSVTGTGFFSSKVNWSVSGNVSENTTINSMGMLAVGKDETVKTLTVTATSEMDSTKSGTATVTVAGN